MNHRFLGDVYSLTVCRIHKSYILMIPSGIEISKRGKHPFLLLLSVPAKCITWPKKRKEKERGSAESPSKSSQLTAWESYSLPRAHCSLEGPSRCRAVKFGSMTVTAGLEMGPGWHSCWGDPGWKTTQNLQFFQ